MHPRGKSVEPCELNATRPNYVSKCLQIIITYLLSKFSKLHNLESQLCELLRLRAPPFQKITINPLNQVTFMQKSCFLGPTIFKIPQPT